jgi:hypothetical protein
MLRAGGVGMVGLTLPFWMLTFEIRFDERCEEMDEGIPSLL